MTHLRNDESDNVAKPEPLNQSSRYSVLSTRYLVLLLAFLLAAAPLFAQPAAETARHASPPPATDWPAMLFVFMLASFIGLGVITRVSRLLHTPLMSLTNAISAIAVVGAITMAGSEHSFPITLLAAIALFASTTNIVSGFLITDRMLKMFKRQEPRA